MASVCFVHTQGFRSLLPQQLIGLARRVAAMKAKATCFRSMGACLRPPTVRRGGFSNAGQYPCYYHRSSSSSSSSRSSNNVFSRQYFSSAPTFNLNKNGNSHGLFMTAVEEDETVDSTKTLDSEWNIHELSKEVQRLVMRCLKKVGKANERLSNARVTVESLATNPEASLEELENCPNVEALQLALQEVQDRLKKLQELEECLSTLKKKKGVGRNVVLPKHVAELALELGVDDKPPPKQERGPPKGKGPRSMESTRLPYRRYYSFDNIEIRVGKMAQDNDLLTLSPEHRDSRDFWMHAAGCPGSHVVIRAQGRSVLPEEVIQDAAALAARQSKASASAVVAVSMTICRDIIKPPGAKPGLVQLTGKVQTIKVNMKEAKKRLDRLDSTCLVN